MEGAIFAAGANVLLSASASDSDGTVAKVYFYDGATLLGTVNGGSSSVNASLTYNGVPSGNHTLTAIATDNLNAATTSAPVHITVNVNRPLSGTLVSS